MFLNRFASLPLLLVGFVVLNGCSSTPPSQFYLLEPVTHSELNSAALTEKMPVVLATVRIPKYADRPQIVSATAKNAYQISEFNRWAENLDENITRVLAQNLSRLAPVDVFLSNSNLAKQAKVRLSVTLLEFYVNPQGQAEVVAQWHLAQGDERLLSRQMTYTAPASTIDYQRMVEALNDCLNRMSGDIAASLNTAAIR
jgi:uncharacterized lipoprotein YmbA